MKPVQLPTARSTEQRLWYVLIDKEGRLFAQTTVNSVALPGSAMIEEFRRAVKAENAEILGMISKPRLLIYRNMAAYMTKKPSLRLSSLVSTIGETSEDIFEALVVLVPPAAMLFEVSSHKVRQLAKQKLLPSPLSMQATCRMFMDSVAYELGLWYDFARRYRKGRATVEDLLEAVNGGHGVQGHDWDYVRKSVNSKTVGDDGDRDRKVTGAPQRDVPLTLFLTPEEWNAVEQLDYEANDCKPGSLYPAKDCFGKYYIILPRNENTDVLAQAMKKLGVAAYFLDSEDDLKVIIQALP
jgi:hypothetical protein